MNTLSPADFIRTPHASSVANPAPETFDGLFSHFDRLLHVTLAHATSGLSPLSILLAWQDWLTHAAINPGRLTDHMIKGLAAAGMVSATSLAGKGAGYKDPRFRGPAWQQWPYNTLADATVALEMWTDELLAAVPGVTRQNKALVRFWARQWLQAFSISNIPATNADIAQATLDQRGLNLVKGFCAFYRDVSRQLTTTSKAPAALLGTRLASTPGKVVLRTELAEIIQYTPSTRHVRPEPVVIVPAWIMKYYILDLSHDRSLVRYLVDQGFTVFIISWKNPDTDERDLTLDDYRRQGIDAAIRAALAITGSRKCHLAGYCLGGTAAVIEAATLARDGKDNLASLSLLAAQIDFTDAGPLKLFINSDQLSLLDDAMWWNGALTADQMAGAFRLLRAHEMLWSHAIESYFLDEDANPADLQIWNADATRMPYRMHSEYLHRLFHDNDLAEGRYVVEGRAVSCADIHVPVFAVGTETDFVAPWQSVYKIDHLVSGPVTFVLANGGHNAGIVAPPGDERRNYRLRGRGCDGLHLNAANWFETADHHAGSWWTAWAAWLHENSGDFVQTPTLGGAADAILPLADAPGTYVFG